MKKILLLLIIGAYCGIAAAQKAPKFNLTKDGVAPVVLTFDASFTANQIYTKAKGWNTSKNKYPQASIRVDKENTQLKLAGYIEKAWKIRANNFDHWYPLDYALNIEIKDGRCRVSFETAENRYKVWYDKKGAIIPKFKDSEATFEATINELLTSLYTFIKTTPKKTEDNW